MKVYTQQEVHKSISCPFLSELALEEWLVLNPDALSITDNCPTPDLQYELSIVGNKRIDILAHYDELSVDAIVELKKGNLDKKALDQVLKYHKVYCANIFGSSASPSKIVCGLVGSSIDNTLLEDLIQNDFHRGDVEIFVGIVARSKDEIANMVTVSVDYKYSSTSVFSQTTSTQYDKTKYSFNGQIYNKRRLVLAIINHYVAANPTVNYPHLQQTFDKAVIRLEEIGENRSVRYFSSDNDLITLSDGTSVAVSNQWGIGNIGEFIKIAKELGYKIEEVK